MKINKFSYEVSMHIELTREELDLIRNCARGHYDAVVVQAALHGGFMYGWNNIQLDSDGILVCSSFRELDTCAKALEQPSVLPEKDGRARGQLRATITRALISINEETRRVNEATVATGMSM